MSVQLINVASLISCIFSLTWINLQTFMLDLCFLWGLTWKICTWHLPFYSQLLTHQIFSFIFLWIIHMAFALQQKYLIIFYFLLQKVGEDNYPKTYIKGENQNLVRGKYVYRFILDKTISPEVFPCLGIKSNYFSSTKVCSY